MERLETIRCPKCNRRLADISEDTVGHIERQCKCKDKVLMTYLSKDKITFKTK